MNTLSVRGQVLKLTGPRHTLDRALAHNTRSGYAVKGQYGRIMFKDRYKNLELISLADKPIRERVLELLTERGIDINGPRMRNKNRGYGVEFLFTVTAGHRCNFDALYGLCLQWLISYLPECPVLSAVIHYDEADPHLHAIVVPIEGGRLAADCVRGFRTSSRDRNRAVYDFVNGERFGLTYPERLVGATKAIGAELAKKALWELSDQEIRRSVGKEIERAIHARPEPFLSALGIRLGDVLSQYQSASEQT